MKYIPGSFSHLFSLFYGSQVLSSLPLLSWLVNSRGIKQKSSFLCKLKICIYGIYVPFSGFMRIRPVWSEWQGWVILGEKTKILCLQVPIKYTCIVCLFWYSIPLKLPLLKMSFRIEKYRLLHRKGYLFAPGPRGFQWNISVLMTAVFSRKILLSF